MENTFAILGGDKRQLYLARALAGDGYPVLLGGMEQAPDTFGLPQAPLDLLAQRCTTFVLPLPVSRDGVFLNAPYAERPLPLDAAFLRLTEGRRVFGGMLSRWKDAPASWQDYYTQEELTIGNAYLTAEGAVALAGGEWPGTLGGARCLVAGFGRIGKALCGMLQGMGAQVFCAARKPAHWAAIRALGCIPLSYQETGRAFDIIFNTVPAQVLGEEMLALQGRDALLMELASAPGGFDREAAQQLGLRIMDAPSLPGKLSPRAAGELLKTTICHML